MSVSRIRRLFALQKQEQKLQAQVLWAQGDQKEILLIQLANVRQVIRALNASK